AHLAVAVAAGLGARNLHGQRGAREPRPDRRGGVGAGRAVAELQRLAVGKRHGHTHRSAGGYPPPLALSDPGPPPAARVPAHPRAPALVDPRLSRSLLRGLALLARFGPGRARGVVELAAELQMSPSTAHRYVLTLVEAGLLEQVPGTRKYRLAGSGDSRERA